MHRDKVGCSTRARALRLDHSEMKTMKSDTRSTVMKLQHGDDTTKILNLFQRLRQSIIIYSCYYLLPLFTPMPGFIYVTLLSISISYICVSNNNVSVPFTSVHNTAAVTGKAKWNATIINIKV